ncbi:putative HTH-type transcriptional regulator [Mycobacterium saskatchewanense]|uniref:GntR family transcriptional regulator n=1 Tax=Mycobacterium saskatchewanense TaxID=220927 RepID=A0AAJ3TU52_9MYCO|nr:GntR family transcriptional regulator [Mycobacterium saskatchewanense]ORW63908.1 GntR family transcriptional regulator [Mycobacterium saskatchewanense]BBX65046.1 putative HTH-type transcriptional regulator [Mycobacterium saskatchewanense]
MNQSTPLQPPDRQRVDEQIAASIADAILDGVFPPGSALPPERELAERLEVNRTSLRQGLARLQQMGLIEARHGSGNVVRDPQGLTHPAVVEALVRKLGPEFLVELLEIRAALGPLIGRLAAQRGGPEDADALRAALAAVQDADGAAARQAADLDYFRVLIHCSRNRALGLLYRWVEQAFGGREHELTAAYDDAGPVVADLAAITEAVLAGDAAAAGAAVEAYLLASAQRMVLAYTNIQPG